MKHTPSYTWEKGKLRGKNFKNTRNFRASQELPVDEYKEQIIASVDNNDEVIISAETGAGKSTRVPQFLCNAGYNVIVTQPRRIAAITLAKHVAREMNTSLWDGVGYHIWWWNMEDKRFSEQTGIKFCTDWLQLIQQLVAKPKHVLDDRETVLVIDEVHERNQNIEILLAWVKKEKQLGRKIKIVIMSATIESNELSDFFAEKDIEEEQNKIVPVIDVPGRLFPIQEETWEYWEIDTIVDWLVNEGKNTLIFQPGKQEINDCISGLQQKIWDKAIILPLHGELTVEEQEKIFASYDIPVIVVATNVAQTSITIPYINAVVDTWLEKRIEIIDGVESLIVWYVSKADCKQRAWRAGRCWPWQYIYCWPKNRNDLREYPTPEIQRTRLDLNYLRIFAKTWYAMEDLSFVHQPKNQDIQQAKITLQKLWAIDKDNNITSLWKKVVELPVDVHEWCMIVQACKEWVLDDVLKIAAIKEQWWILFADKEWTYSPPTSIKNDKSDLISHLNLFNIWMDCRKTYFLDNGDTDMSDQQYRTKERKRKDRLKSHCINVKSFFRAMEKYKQLKSLFKKELFQQKTIEYTAEERQTAILKCITVGMLDNIWITTETQSKRWGTVSYYKSEPDDDERSISHRSYVDNPYIVSGDALNIQTRMGLLKILTQTNIVEFDWLQEFAPHMVQEHIKDDDRSNQQQKVLHEIEKTFNGIYVCSEKKESVCSDTSVQVFCTALAQWYVYSDNDIFNTIQIHNKEVFEQLEQLAVKTAGSIKSMSQKGLSDYFYEILHNKGIITTQDLILYLQKDPEALFQTLTLNPPHMLIRDYKKILAKYPEQICIGDVIYPVKYEKGRYSSYKISICIQEEDIETISSKDLIGYFEGKKYVFLCEKNGREFEIQDIEQYKQQRNEEYKKAKRDEFDNIYNIDQEVYNIENYQGNRVIQEKCYDEEKQLYAYLWLVSRRENGIQMYYQQRFFKKSDAEEYTNEVDRLYQKLIEEKKEIQHRKEKEEQIEKEYQEILTTYDIPEHVIHLFYGRSDFVEFFRNLKKINPNTLDAHELSCGRARASDTIYQAFEWEGEFCSVDINDIKYFIYDRFFGGDIGYYETEEYEESLNDQEEWEESTLPLDNIANIEELLASKFTVIKSKK
jgi:HrpA-like RNA helicase